MDKLLRSQNLREQVTEQLMLAIFRQKLVSGDRLIVVKVAQQLGVSASPVREALVELASVGLVELLPNRGAVCLPFSPRQLREIFHVRRLLEAEAARLAAGGMPPKQLQNLRQQLESLLESEHASAAWSERATDVDVALHDLIVRHSQNHRLRHEIGRYATVMRSIRIAAGNQRDIQVRAISDHLAIIDALLGSQREAAAKLMEEHVSNTAEGLVELMFANSQEADQAIDGQGRHRSLALEAEKTEDAVNQEGLR